MQELIMTTKFNPTENVPSGLFPSAAFCVFSNRFLAVIVAIIAVRIKHGAFFANNAAPLWAFTPCAISNTMSSWSQYASLKFVSFPVQTVFKSSKIIPVMMMGKLLKGTSYPLGQYLEAILITTGRF
jgi:adenosine 3'-phospho 5'-phosphosulfate transporter B2